MRRMRPNQHSCSYINVRHPADTKLATSRWHTSAIVTTLWVGLAFYVSDDLSQDTTEPFADGDDARAIELRRFDVQELIDAAGHPPTKNSRRTTPRSARCWPARRRWVHMLPVMTSPLSHSLASAPRKKKRSRLKQRSHSTVPALRWLAEKAFLTTISCASSA